MCSASPFRTTMGHSAMMRSTSLWDSSLVCLISYWNRKQTVIRWVKTGHCRCTSDFSFNEKKKMKQSKLNWNSGIKKCSNGEKILKQTSLQFICSCSCRCPCCIVKNSRLQNNSCLLYKKKCIFQDAAALYILPHSTHAIKEDYSHILSRANQQTSHTLVGLDSFALWHL